MDKKYTINTEILAKAKDFSQANIDKAIDAVKNVGEAKSTIILLLINVDYDFLLKNLNENKELFPPVEILISTLEAFKEVSEAVKASDDNELKWAMIQSVLQRVNLNQAVNELEPIINMLPFKLGGIVMFLLKMLIKYVGSMNGQNHIKKVTKELATSGKSFIENKEEKIKTSFMGKLNKLKDMIPKGQNVTSTPSSIVVKQDGTAIKVFDETGRLLKSTSAGAGKLAGYGADFFVVIKGSSAITYIIQCVQIKGVPLGRKHFKGVGGNSFSLSDGNVITSYNKEGKLLSTIKDMG